MSDQVKQDKAKGAIVLNHNNPELFEGNCVSRFFLTHLNKICDVGGERPYLFSDLYRLAGDFTTLAYKDFRKFFDSETAGEEGKKKSFFMVLIRGVKKYLYTGGFLFFLVNIIQVITPIFLRLFLNWLQSSMPESENWKGYFYAAMLASVLIMRAFFSQHAMEMLHSGAVIMGNYCGCLIADKISNIPPGARKFINVGKITNFLTSDIRSLQGSVMTVHQIVVTPILLMVYVGMIIAVTSWVGLLVPVVIIICVPLQVKLNGMFMNQNKSRMILADKRAKLVNQMITGIKNIKFNAWEKVMIDQCNNIREQEKALVVKGFLLKGLGDSFAKLIPTFCTVVVIWVYNAAYPDDKLGVGDTFYVITLFNLFLTPINVLLFALLNVATASVSAQRIKELSQIEDYQPLKDDQNLPTGAIEFNKANFGWVDYNYEKIFNPKTQLTPESARGEANMILKNLTTRINAGEFVAVVGKVGCGKSSFLLACLNEMLNMGGVVTKRGRIAHIPQEAFLLNDTLKNNVLFGKEFDAALYAKAIQLSQLPQDLKELPGGEETEIGERGINLSGGQKQRVLIARAIYSESDIFLIDDSLSALDAYVGKRVFEDLFCSFWKGKTRVMVTHHLHVLEDKNIDRVIFIEKGEIVAQGSLASIRSHPKFQEYSSESDKEEAKEENATKKYSDSLVKPEQLQLTKLPTVDAGESTTPRPTPAPTAPKKVGDFTEPEKPQQIAEKEQVPTSEPKEAGQPSSPAEKPANLPQITTTVTTTAAKTTDDTASDQEKGKLTKSEVRFQGQVPLSIYWRYLSSGNAFYGILAILMFFLNALAITVSNFWAGEWANRSTDWFWFKRNDDNGYGVVFLILVAIIIVSIVLRSLLFGMFSSRSSFILFNQVIYNVLRRPMSFFDTTPNGVIMNRCNDDIYQVDFMVPSTFAFFLDSFSVFMLSIILIMIVLPVLIVVVVILGTFLFFAMRKYMRTAVELRRLSQLSATPVLNKVSEVIGGVVSVRAYGKTEWLKQKYSDCLTVMTSSMIHERLSAVWVNFRLEIIVGIFGACTPFMIALMKTEGWNLTSANDEKSRNIIYGTIMTNVFLLGNSVAFLIFSFSEVAKGMSSVQRLIEYIDYTIHERVWEEPKAPANWPTIGEIEFKNVHIRYREKLPLVIKNLDFKIGSHQKIGIVGRTGSGKSTILLSLVRILEQAEDLGPEGQPGKIIIDGVQIDQIGLHELRKNLVVIPQDPFLVQGTLRFNIDPLQQYSDEQILASLQTVQILDNIRTEDIKEQKIKAYKAKKAAAAGGPPGGPFGGPPGAGGPPGGRPAGPPGGKPPGPSASKSEVAPEDKKPEEEDPEIIKIRNMVISEKDKLEFAIESGGTNLSVGERQLICIARSLIRKPKILLMDEATANIDQKTDSIIQRVIKGSMGQTTVITIAHRLVTIIQYDKILILEQGMKKEEGSPLQLLESKGYFHKLVSEGGPQFEEKMRRLATDRSLDPNTLEAEMNQRY